jgi:hypothetical protein
LCWFNNSPSSQAQLLISLQGGALVCITPPMQPYSSSTSAATSPSEALELSPSQVQWQSTSTEVPLLKLAAVPPSSNGNSKPAGLSSSGGRSEQQQQQQQQQQQALGAQIVGLSSDGELHRLLLPSDTATWAALKGKVLRSTAKLQLAAPGAVIAVSPGGQHMLLATQDGSLSVLPASSAAATAAALHSSGRGAVVLGHSGAEGQCAAALAWSVGGGWAASAAADGSLLVHTVAGKLL